MIRLCLFDLDQTLVDTEDMKELREAGKHRDDAAYADEVRAAFRKRDRVLVSSLALNLVKLNNMDLRFGIFTRSPRRYVDVVLAEAYENRRWDVVIAYEDVQRYKPSGQGIIRAMKAVGMQTVAELQHVLMVGDGDVDIRAAYHAGCRVALYKPGWPQRYERTHWQSLGLLPDTVIEKPEDLLAGVATPDAGLPDLEHLLVHGGQAPAKPRFDDIGKFYPNDRARQAVHVAGRYFAHFDSLQRRRDWHLLTQSIQDNKESTVFPPAWIETIRRFIAYHYRMITAMPIFVGNGPEVVITAIPARPGRVHRLAHLVGQLQASYGDNPRLNRLQLSFDPHVLAYKPGVQSHSHEHLNQEQRMANVRDHLYVANPAAVQGKKVLVIDDVTTTGATLLYAKKYMEEAGARSVDCFSIAQTISDPLRH